MLDVIKNIFVLVAAIAGLVGIFVLIRYQILINARTRRTSAAMKELTKLSASLKKTQTETVKVTTDSTQRSAELIADALYQLKEAQSEGAKKAGTSLTSLTSEVKKAAAAAQSQSKQLVSASRGAQKAANSASKFSKIVAEHAGWFTPQTVGGFTAEEIKEVDARAIARSAELLARPVDAIAPIASGARIALGVGESLMAGTGNSARLTMVADQALAGIDHRAVMIGTSERSKSDGAEFEPFGRGSLKPLTETLVHHGTVYSDDARLSGDFHPAARGATPLAAAAFIFERLLDDHRKAAGETEPQADDFDIAVNAARNVLNIAHEASSIPVDQAKDAIRKGLEAGRPRSQKKPQAYHSVTLERHGQSDEANTTQDPAYVADHRSYRAGINAVSLNFGGTGQPAAWIATQVSGAFASPKRLTAQGQLSMALSDPDYFLATPDYPFPHFGKVAPSHPRAGDANPSANGVLMSAVYMAHARFAVQVLNRNWFPTHMAEAFFRGHYILVSFSAMVPPLRISKVCVSTTLTMIEALGFDVEDNGVPVRIVGMPELVGELTFRIQCAKELTDPIVGLGKGSFGLATTGAMGSGATNIVDSQKLEPFFRPQFKEGYTDRFARGKVDEDAQEDIEDFFESFEFGNWAALQRVSCRPMPILERGAPTAHRDEDESDGPDEN